MWILLKQETVSGSGISWAIRKSAPCSRQITTPAPHHSVFRGRMPFLPPNQQRQSTEGTSAGRTNVDIWASAKLELVDKFCYLGDMLSVDGDADAAVEARIRIGWNKFRQLVPLLTNEDVSVTMTGRLYSSCVRSSMLHGSETWPVRKENVVALQRAEMRMVRWMCGVQLKETPK